MNRNLVVTIVLFSAALASWILVGGKKDKQPVVNTSTDTGYYLRGATIEGLDDNGRRIYTLMADRIVQRPGQAVVVLQDVSLEYALPGSEPWELFADNGEIPASGETIALRGNVTMNEQLMRGMPLTKIRTAALDIDLQTHTAMSEHQVDIERGNYSLSSTGMTADFQAQTLKLRSQVNGRFLP